jgi:hypothetical protein
VAVYATVDDLEDELSGQPTPLNPDRLLVLASATVDAMLIGCAYTVNVSTGLPSYPSDQEKLKRLTVLQAVWMADDPDGQREDYVSVRTSTVSVNRPQPRPRYAPRAVEYLASHGMPGSGIRVWT